MPPLTPRPSPTATVAVPRRRRARSPPLPPCLSPAAAVTVLVYKGRLQGADCACRGIIRYLASITRYVVEIV
uniref:Uncharacterized protein n=1 Tax=Oryza rufipogon TaxID=4529 RepID=A0A0E0PCW7_ORYRU